MVLIIIIVIIVFIFAVNKPRTDLKICKYCNNFSADSAKCSHTQKVVSAYDTCENYPGSVERAAENQESSEEGQEEYSEVHSSTCAICGRKNKSSIYLESHNGLCGKCSSREEYFVVLSNQGLNNNKEVPWATLVRHKKDGYMGWIEGVTSIKNLFTGNKDCDWQFRIAVRGNDIRKVAPGEDLEVIDVNENSSATKIIEKIKKHSEIPEELVAWIKLYSKKGTNRKDIINGLILENRIDLAMWFLIRSMVNDEYIEYAISMLEKVSSRFRSYSKTKDISAINRCNVDIILDEKKWFSNTVALLSKIEAQLSLVKQQIYEKKSSEKSMPYSSEKEIYSGDLELYEVAKIIRNDRQHNTKDLNLDSPLEKSVQQRECTDCKEEITKEHIFAAVKDIIDFSIDILKAIKENRDALKGNDYLEDEEKYGIMKAIEVKILKEGIIFLN